MLMNYRNETEREMRGGCVICTEEEEGEIHGCIMMSRWKKKNDKEEEGIR